jgi:hypothetical protein
MVIAEIHNWIALSPKLPKMSLLGEMHYISKVVLPELCIFALGCINQVSSKDAEIIYNKALKEKTTPSPPAAVAATTTITTTRRYNSRTVEPSFSAPDTGNSFEQLLQAVRSVDH